MAGVGDEGQIQTRLPTAVILIDRIQLPSGEDQSIMVSVMCREFIFISSCAASTNLAAITPVKKKATPRGLQLPANLYEQLILSLL